MTQNADVMFSGPRVLYSTCSATAARKEEDTDQISAVTTTAQLLYPKWHFVIHRNFIVPPAFSPTTTCSPNKGLWRGTKVGHERHVRTSIWDPDPIRDSFYSSGSCWENRPAPRSVAQQLVPAPLHCRFFCKAGQQQAVEY